MTQEDLDNNPGLEKEVQAGDTVGIPSEEEVLTEDLEAIKDKTLEEMTEAPTAEEITEDAVEA